MLHERDDIPTFCPIILLLALAFSDNAFANSDIKGPRDLYSLHIEEGEYIIPIRWKDSIFDTPIFRAAEANYLGNMISETRAYDAAKLSSHMRDLEFNAGFEHVLMPYCLRRAAANSADRKLIVPFPSLLRPFGFGC